MGVKSCGLVFFFACSILTHAVADRDIQAFDNYFIESIFYVHILSAAGLCH